MTHLIVVTEKLKMFGKFFNKTIYKVNNMMYNVYNKEIDMSWGLRTSFFMRELSS